jgi:prevent-host-death family protein
MVTVNIHTAQKQLSKLLDRAAKGETIVITRAGKPPVRLVAVEAPNDPRRLGFMTGEISVPENFNRIAESQIAALFGAGP